MDAVALLFEVFRSGDVAATVAVLVTFPFFWLLSVTIVTVASAPEAMEPKEHWTVRVDD